MAKFISETIETVLITLVVFIVLQTAIQNFQVQGSSMKPTLLPADRIVVNKIPTFRIPMGTIGDTLPWLLSSDEKDHYLFGKYDRGSIVVFKSPDESGQDLVKRIIGIPGDTISINDGKVFVNGNLIEEPYVESQGSSKTSDLQVPNNHYFVLGDNRPWSNDSRHWVFSFVEESLIIGKAWMIYWPKDRMSVLKDHSSEERLDPEN